MTGSWSTGRHGAKYAHYYCRNTRCKYVWQTKKKIDFENDFEVFLIQRKPEDWLIDLTQEVLMEQWQQKVENHSLFLTNTQEALEEVANKIRSYVERVGKTTDEDLVAEYEAEIKKLQNLVPLKTQMWTMRGSNPRHLQCK